MQENGLDAITIRRLGKELDCNTANLYRYFDSLEVLKMYAVLHLLQGYLADVSVLFRKESDSLSRYYGVWDCFAKHSFAHAPEFNLLFFSHYSPQLFLIIRDYYNMYPEALVPFDSHMRSVFTQGDFDFRDYLMVDECARQGYIRSDDVLALNRIAINLYKGHFKKVLDLKPGTEGQDYEREKFLSLLHFIFERCRIAK